jgi:hypothetical protein
VLNKIVYYIKQCFKLSYYSCFAEEENKVVMTWDMWFGKCYNIKKYIIKEELKWTQLKEK